MTAKETLERMLYLNAQINRKYEQIDEIHSRLINITVAGDSERVKSSPDPDKISCLMSRILDIEEDIDILIDALRTRKKIFYKNLALMDRLEDKEILCMKYIDGMSYSEIANRLNVSIRWIKSKNKNAIKEYEKAIKHKI